VASAEECKMDNSELIGELLEALTKDVKALSLRVEKLPTTAPADYRREIERLSKALEQLQNEPKSAPAVVDLSPITTRLERIEHLSRQRPEYRMSQYVQYGAYAFGLMVVLLATSVWFALSWRSEREEYAQAYSENNWRVRYTQQANPDYYNFMEGKFAKDPDVYQWIAEQEQADEKRELAQRAADQAKALSDQANKLEGKSNQKGRKK
jgi:hypothetical protein